MRAWGTPTLSLTRSEEYELPLTLQCDRGEETHYVGMLPSTKKLYSSGNQPITPVASSTVPDVSARQTNACSGRSAARPAAEPERYVAEAKK